MTKHKLIQDLLWLMFDVIATFLIFAAIAGGGYLLNAFIGLEMWIGSLITLAILVVWLFISLIRIVKGY